MKQNVLIYAIIETSTGDCYVGSTINRRARWNEHRSQLRRGGHHCRALQAAWTRAGEEAFEFVDLVIGDCDDRAERLALEAGWITTLATYNRESVDERSGAFTMAPHSRALLSAALTTKRHLDPEYRAFLEERGRAIAAYMKSPEGRANMGKHTTRRWTEPEERAKLARGLENRWSDPDARGHMSKVTGERMRAGTAAKEHSAKMRAAWQDPEKRAKLQARLDARWADPEAKARQSEATRQRWIRWRAERDHPKYGS